MRHCYTCTLYTVFQRIAHDVVIEPRLQPVTGEQFRYRSANIEDQARLDVAACGVWGGRFERSFVDVRVFNPFASSNRSHSVTSAYARHEREKRRQYEQRIRDVEQSSFVPVVLSSSGGMGKSATSLFKRLASLISEKSGEPYSATMAWIRCRVSFALLRSSVMCIRGSRCLRSRFISGELESSAAVLAVADAAIRSV